MTSLFQDAVRFYTARDLGRSAHICLDVLREDPEHFDALHLLGVICTNQGQQADAVSYLLRAEALRPDDARLQSNLGCAYGAVQRFDKAVEAHLRAIALHHRDAGVLNNLGLALQGLKQHQAAIETFTAALALDPACDPALYNRAQARADVGDLAGAEADYRLLWARLRPKTPAGRLSALPDMPPGQIGTRPETSPDRVGDVVNGLARVLIDQGRAVESLGILRSAGDHLPSPRWNESLILLLLGRFSEGWEAYEARWNAPNHDKPHPDYRVLDLDAVAGRRVLVKGEQGRGDVIQFLRYLQPLAALGARVHLSVYDDLLALAKEIPEIDDAIGPGDDEIEYDLLTSVMSLPLAFRTELGTIPAAVPYLRTPAARIARMRQHLGSASGPRIGLVWSGSFVSQARAAMPPATLEPLLRQQGVAFHCLQKIIGDEDRAWLEHHGLIETHEAVLDDFADTAALIEAMDLVISIDTAVAHLAGALAKPVWIMLAFNPDWRWLLGRDDTPWYPTVRLFRQEKPRDWSNVMQSVAAALRDRYSPGTVQTADAPPQDLSAPGPDQGMRARAIVR